MGKSGSTEQSEITYYTIQYTTTFFDILYIKYFWSM